MNGKKVFFVWMLVLSFFIAAAIFNTVAFASEETTKLTFFGWITSFEPKTWEYMTSKFEQANPGVKIENIGVSYEEAERQLVLLVAGGNAPDFAQLDTINGFTLAAMQALEPIGNLISKDVQSDINPSLLEAAKYNDELVFIPWAPTPYALFSNKLLLKKAGYSNPPRTIKEFEEMAYKVHEVAPVDEQGNKIWCFSIAGKKDIHIPYLLSPWLYNFGGNWFDDQGMCRINDEAGVKLLTWLQNMAKDGILGPTPVDREMARQIFAKDQMLFIGEGPWQRGLWREQSGLGEEFDNHWIVSTYPSLDDPNKPGMSIVYSHVLGIMRQSKNKELAAKFIEFLITNDDINEYYYNVSGMLPIINSQMERDIFQEEYAQTFVKQMQAGGYIPFSPYKDKQNVFAPFVCEHYQSIIVNYSDVKLTLDKLANQLNTIVGR